MEVKEYDVIIIGAGISGLSMAHYCSQAGLKCLLIEKSERVGGAVHSHFFGGDAADYWLELGPHTCYNSYGNVIKILETYQLLGEIIERRKVPFKALVDGEVKSLTSQINFARLIFSAPRLFFTAKKNADIKSYYGRIVGRRNYNSIFRALFSGVVSQPADDFPAALLFKKRPRRADIPKNFTFKRGLQSIVEAVAGGGGIDIITGGEAAGVRYSDGEFSLNTRGIDYQARYLAVATPATAATRLLREAFPDIAAELAKIAVRKVETTAVAAPKEALEVPEASIIIPADDAFYSIVTRDVVPHPTWRGFTFHFKPDTLSQQDKLKRISEILKTGAENLRHVVNKLNYVPALKVDNERITSKLDELINEKPLFLTGNYFLGMALEDCVSRSRREFTRLQQSLQR